MSRFEIATTYFNSNPDIKSEDFRRWYVTTFNANPHTARSVWSKVRGVGVRGTYEVGARGPNKKYGK